MSKISKSLIVIVAIAVNVLILLPWIQRPKAPAVPVAVTYKPKIQAPAPAKVTRVPRALSGPAATDPSEEAAILAEFRRMGGTLDEKMVEDQMTTVVQQQFGGDQDAFEFALQEQGMTLENFKERRRTDTIVRAMKQRIARSYSDPEEARRAVEAWIAGLQGKSAPAE